MTRLSIPELTCQLLNSAKHLHGTLNVTAALLTPSNVTLIYSDGHTFHWPIADQSLDGSEHRSDQELELAGPSTQSGPTTDQLEPVTLTLPNDDPAVDI